MTPELRQKVREVPTNPGIYLYKNEAGTIIYIGKAKNLRKRVSSYFTRKHEVVHGYAGELKTQYLVADIRDLDYVITKTEAEALLLESSFIKKHLPKYNIQLKDDKNFLYIKVTTNEKWPTVELVRHPQKDRAKYFGPYTNSRMLRLSIRALRTAFPYRTCKPETGRACFYYHIGQCLGPCVGAVSKEEYDKMIAQLLAYLGKRDTNLIPEFTAAMEAASAKKEFERAARLRDRLQALKLLLQKQTTVMGVHDNLDIINVHRDHGIGAIQLFMVRHGLLSQKEHFILENLYDDDDAAVFEAFLTRYYSEAQDLPDAAVLPIKIPNAKLLTQAIKKERGERIDFITAERGIKNQLLEMAAVNAREELGWEMKDRASIRQKLDAALATLQRELRLPGKPHRIECYDISNIQGTSAVSSMVVFTDGLPDKRQYRKFKIKTVIGANDVASMQETLRRRFKNENWPKPDLLLIDGGKPQLNAVTQVMRELGNTTPVVALAKQEEELFQPGRDGSLVLDRHDEALFLVQRIRDEAHRFAITYHRVLRGKKAHQSALDTIPGIGSNKKRILIRTFGSLDKIRSASVEELEKLVGKKPAANLKELL